MQQLTEVFRMVTINLKEREDSAQSRNKTNLRALKIQNGFHISLILLSTLLKNDAFAKLGAHACNLMLKIWKYG